MTGKKGRFGKHGTIQTILCGASSEDALFTGAADGSIYRWEGHLVSKSVRQAHGQGVDAIFCHRSQVVLSGGRDGKVCLWDTQLIQTGCFDLDKSSVDAAVRSVAMHHRHPTILVGTRGGEIYEISSKDGTVLGGAARIRSHSKHELWGLAVSPACTGSGGGTTFCTVGDDATIRVYDIQTRRLVQLAKLTCEARACAYSPDGQLIAVGLGGDIGRGKHRVDGAIRLYRASDLTLLFEDRPSNGWISDVKFSPDGRLVAFGAHDNKIHLYDVSDLSSVKKKAAFTKHNSYITHVDFSADGKTLQVR